MRKQPFIILAGPTAVGKTALSVELARSIGGEIISADSMQVYRGMDVGSAKIRPEEMQGIPHHLIDICEPDEEFHVVKFQQLAKAALKEIYGRGRIPILVGGTGFYIQALLYDIDFTENGGDDRYRSELEELVHTHGKEHLHQLLAAVDPVSAKQIHSNNVKRVIRALEFHHETGEPISAHNEKERQKESPFQFAYFVLTDERAHLYERIDERVDLMIQEGLVAEVQHLQEMGCHKEMVSMQGLGYKEILAYLNGERDLAEVIYTLKRDTRHFAKRQLTWFKRERDVVWIDQSAYGRDKKQVLERMLAVLSEKGLPAGR